MTLAYAVSLGGVRTRRQPARWVGVPGAVVGLVELWCKCKLLGGLCVRAELLVGV